VNLRLVLHLFCIHRLIVPSKPIDLIATINLSLKMRSKSRKFQERLNIWYIIVPKGNVYEKASRFDVDLPPSRRFAMRQIFVTQVQKQVQHYFYHVFGCNSVNIGRTTKSILVVLSSKLKVLMLLYNAYMFTRFFPSYWPRRFSHASQALDASSTISRAGPSVLCSDVLLLSRPHSPILLGYCKYLRL
jgi:hypothetical protein